MLPASPRLKWRQLEAMALWVPKPLVSLLRIRLPLKREVPPKLKELAHLPSVQTFVRHPPPGTKPPPARLIAPVRSPATKVLLLRGEHLQKLILPLPAPCIIPVLNPSPPLPPKGSPKPVENPRLRLPTLLRRLASLPRSNLLPNATAEFAPGSVKGRCLLSRLTLNPRPPSRKLTQCLPGCLLSVPVQSVR